MTEHVSEVGVLSGYREQLPGEYIREYFLQAKRAAAFVLHRGNVMRVVDIEGEQCADIVMFNVTDFEECVNSETTKLLNGTWKPTEGHIIYSIDSNPMFTIVRDRVCENYLGAAQCSEPLNFRRYGVRGTPNCRENLAEVLRPWGIGERRVPGCFTPFMNVPHQPDGRVEIATSSSRAGDFIDLRAEMDMLIGISACPQERNAVNGWKATPLGVLVFCPGEGGH